MMTGHRTEQTVRPRSLGMTPGLGRAATASVVGLLLMFARAIAPVHAADAVTVRAYDLPAYLKDKWKMNEPSMNENSRCAVTWDGSGDIDRMVMSCSIHIRMAAEGERRALKGCEDARREKGIARPCRLVVR